MRGAAPRGQHGQVVDYVNREHRHRITTPSGVDQLGPIAIGVVNQLRHDVVVRDQVPARRHKERRPQLSFGTGASFGDFDLHDLIGITTEHVRSGGVPILRQRRCWA